MKAVLKFIFIAFTGVILLIGCESSISNSDTPGPTTLVAFRIVVDSYVKFTLENSYNTIVETLIDNQLAAGSYEVEIDTYKFSEGIYFYTLVARGINDSSYFETTKKMIVIKR